jgi:DinB superfamily
MTIRQCPEDGGGPLELALEELRTRLAADLDALIAAVGPLNQTQADWKPAPERWSTGEVLHHLVLSNRSFARAVAKLVERGRRDGLNATPGARRSWPRLRGIADVGASGPVKNPDLVTPTHGLPLEQLRRDLAESHRAVAAQVPDLAGLDLAALRLPHPLGFELNLFQWTDIMGAHERRHLHQIETLLASDGFPRASS